MRGDGEETVAWRYFSRDVVPFAAMFVVECTTVGSNTLYKAATLRGLSFYVFVFYSYAVSTLLLLPLSFIFGRSRRLPSAKSPLFFKIFLLGILGFTSQIVGCKGIEYSSPTLASAISNLTPAFTFTLAVIFRMEQILLRSSASQAKIIGAILSISGALVVVLYKGPKVLAAASFTPPSSTFWLQQKLTSFESSWIIGGLLLASQYFLLSVWYILRGVFVSLFSAVTLVEKDDSKAWIIRFDITLISVGATGILNSGYYIIHTWAVSHKGPVYLSMFKPLSILIAAASTTIFLGESIYLGILIGGILISIGFYMVLWGKSKEDKVDILVTIESSPSHKAPLLDN